MSATIAKAAAATDGVQEHVARAIQRLEQDFNGRIIDGRGVYADPSRQRHALTSAITELTAALDLMKTSTWPAD